jgi:uncharacterized phage protein (TIGR02216 family)
MRCASTPTAASRRDRRLARRRDPASVPDARRAGRTRKRLRCRQSGNELAERFENGRLSAGDIIKIRRRRIARRREPRNRRGCGGNVDRGRCRGVRRHCRRTFMGDVWRRRAGTGGQTQSRPGGIPSGGRRKPSRAAGGGAVTKQERALFPWASAIRFGLGRLRLSPRTFWALSLPEFVALIGVRAGRPMQPVNAWHALDGAVSRRGSPAGRWP